jgi:hypothetical protein
LIVSYVHELRKMAAAAVKAAEEESYEEAAAKARAANEAYAKWEAWSKNRGKPMQSVQSINGPKQSVPAAAQPANPVDSRVAATNNAYAQWEDWSKKRGTPMRSAYSINHGQPATAAPAVASAQPAKRRPRSVAQRTPGPTPTAGSIHGIAGGNILGALRGLFGG